MPLTSSTRSARFSVAPARKVNWVVTTYWLRSRSSKSIRRIVTCSPLLAERHRAFAREPGRELLVGLDQPVAPDAHEDRAQPVEDLVGAVGLRGDLRVQANQRLAQVVLDQHLVRLSAKVLRREEVPAEAGHSALPPRETRADGRVVRDAAAQPVADEGFDRVGLVESHSTRP